MQSKQLEAILNLIKNTRNQEGFTVDRMDAMKAFVQGMKQAVDTALFDAQRIGPVPKEGEPDMRKVLVSSDALVALSNDLGEMADEIVKVIVGDPTPPPAKMTADATVTKKA